MNCKSLKERFPKNLARTKYFEEVMLFSPSTYEQMKMDSSNPFQTGGSKLKNAEGRLTGEGDNEYESTEYGEDEDPEVEKQIQKYLYFTNDIHTVMAFRKMRYLKQALKKHFKGTEKLKKTLSVPMVVMEIKRLQKEHGTNFKRMVFAANPNGAINNTTNIYNNGSKKRPSTTHAKGSKKKKKDYVPNKQYPSKDEWSTIDEYEMPLDEKRITNIPHHRTKVPQPLTENKSTKIFSKIWMFSLKKKHTDISKNQKLMKRIPRTQI